MYIVCMYQDVYMYIASITGCTDVCTVCVVLSFYREEV